MHTYICTYRWPTGPQRAIQEHIHANKYMHTCIQYTHPYWQADTYKSREGIPIHNDIHSGMHTYIQTAASQSYIHTGRDRHTYTQSNIHKYMYTHTHIVTHTQRRTCIQPNSYTYLHTYIDIPIHEERHTYAHT